MPSAFGTNQSVIPQLPAGAMIDFAGTSAPAGWLMCDGKSLPTATYPALFAAIGYSFGGSGANFNVPDYRGRFARYNDDMGTDQSPAFVDKSLVTAGSFVVGRKYKIVAVGTTNFTLIGAASNTVGLVFTATGVGSGTGTADESRVGFTAQGQSTAKNGLTATTTGTDGSHVHQNIRSVVGYHSGSSTGEYHPSPTGIASFIGSSSFPLVDSAGSSHGHSIALNDAVNSETRPVNLSCNRIIKY